MLVKLTFLMTACFPVFVKPSNGPPDKTSTDALSKFPLIADNEGSP